MEVCHRHHLDHNCPFGHMELLNEGNTGNKIINWINHMGRIVKHGNEQFIKDQVYFKINT